MTDPYATKVLFREHHERLVANIDSYARDAGIPPRWIWTKLSDVCSPEVCTWVRRFNFHRTGGEVHGLCFIRTSDHADVIQQMSAIAGALVRNFVRARMMTLGSVLDEIAEDGPPEATCLLIPNFFTPKAASGTIATWQVSALYDLLVKRGAQGLQTVISTTSLSDLGKEYGSAFSDLVKHNFDTTTI